ncbi:MAG: RagB/SusD family nutrient uptake outer membrane protein [Spirosomataceae bacterium]
MNIYIKNIVLAGSVVLLGTACDSRLDVQPTQSINESAALATEQDVNVTLVGAFDGISSTNLFGGAFQYAGELLGDDREVVFGGTFTTLDELWRKTITTGNAQTTATWTSAYNTINRANNVLGALDKVTAANKGTVEGQARLIRGAVYFELVKLFAKTWGDGDNTTNPGVPLVLNPTRAVTDDDYKARNSVAEVYAQIIDDLTKAEQLAKLPAAAAFLSRVYLMQGNYALARDAANRVIASGEYELEADFANAFVDDNAETIFSIVVTDQDGSNAMNTYYASSLNQGRGDIRVQSKHLALYEASDIRGKFFNTSNAGTRTFTSKFNDRFGDVPVVRLAEMYLTRAEANFRLGTTVGAAPLADVNLIRTRAGVSALTTLTLAAVLKERKLELAFEGQQVHDIKRTKGIVGTTAYNANNLVLPIPQREIDTNKKLVQNQGY